MRVGEVIHGFKVKRIEELKSQKTSVIELVHEVTGAKYLHLKNEDENNAFSIAFPTTPTDSTGVAHILEHTALTSSEKYPVRDPFFSMMKRSLQTFMNAFTSSDWTMYPFATLNETDYYNLLDVYLQAVFFPKLEEINFRQEGHRLEFETMDNPSTALVYRGVVYNEMKGAMSGGTRQLSQRLSETLFPTITYHHNSGGDPKDIPNLTYKAFVDFHKRHYHPCNAYFYSYGSFDLKKRLAFIEDNYLSKFSAATPPHRFSDEKRHDQPISKVFGYSLDKAEDDGAKSLVQVAWPIGHVTKPELYFTMNILESILLEHTASPLQKILLESGLGKGLTELSGYSKDLRDTFFTVGLQGVKLEDCEKIPSFIKESLKKIVKDGISRDEIEGAIHQLELDTLEVGGGSWPHGLNMLFRFFDSWMHGGDPMRMLDAGPLLATLREKMIKGDYLERMIQDYLIQNPNMITVTLHPDHELAAKEDEKLALQLESIKKSLSEKDKEKIIADAKKLKEHQEKEEDLEILPKIGVGDLRKEIRNHPVKPIVKSGEGYVAHLYEAPTNGISYINFLFGTDHLDVFERKLLPLFCELFAELSTEKRSFDELLRKISLYTGGIGASPAILRNHKNGTISGVLNIESKSIKRNIGQMFELLTELLMISRFDETERAVTLIKQKHNLIQNRVLDRGHQYAAMLANSKISYSSLVSNRNSGPLMMELLDQFVKTDGETIKSLFTLMQKVFVRGDLKILAVSEKENLETLQNEIESLTKRLPILKMSKISENFEPGFDAVAYTLTAPVSYVAKSFIVPKITHEDAPKLMLLAALLRQSYLHREIREKGGAYGGNASYNSNDGTFTFTSYRDPHLKRTLGVYDDALKWFRESNVSERELHEAIISIFADLDTPLSPSAEAERDFYRELSLLSDETRQKFRDGIRLATISELLVVAEKYLVNDSSIAALTSKEKAESEGEGKLVIKPLF